MAINYRLSFLGGCDLSVLKGYTDEYADAVNLSKLDQMQALLTTLKMLDDAIKAGELPETSLMN